MFSHSLQMVAMNPWPWQSLNVLGFVVFMQTRPSWITGLQSKQGPHMLRINSIQLNFTRLFGGFITLFPESKHLKNNLIQNTKIFLYQFSTFPMDEVTQTPRILGLGEGLRVCRIYANSSARGRRKGSDKNTQPILVEDKLVPIESHQTHTIPKKKATLFSK